MGIRDRTNFTSYSKIKPFSWMLHVNIQDIQIYKHNYNLAWSFFPNRWMKSFLCSSLKPEKILTIFQLPVWILRCCCRWQSCLKPLSQNEQMCLRIPVCTKLCCASCCLLLKPLLQFGQRWVRSGWTVELTSTKCWSLEVIWGSSGVMSELSVGWDRLKSEIM